MKKLNLITIFVLLHVNLALGATYVLDLGWQDIQFTNSMALGESATLEIRNNGGAASAGIMVYLTDRTKSVLALCTNLTDGTITNSSVGTLNLATTNLAGKFTDAGPHAEKTFSLTVWDATANRMLASAPIVIRNNPIADEIMNGWTNIPTEVQNELEASIQGISELATEASETASASLTASTDAQAMATYASNRANSAYALAEQGGGTTPVSYGVSSNTAYRGDFGAASSNMAAAASATGTAAYALASSKVGTNHTGNVSVIGRVGIGTNAVTAYPPTRTNAANLLHLVDGGIYLEDKPHLLGGGSATSQTAAIFLGYDSREFGRPALWLNSYDYEENGNTYDAASDIYFGKGAEFTDASLRWGLSSRPTNQGWGHESDGQFLIYEFPGLGSSGVGGTRFSIFPDSGGIGGPIKLGTEVRYPPPSPDPSATLVVNDWTKSPVIVIEGNTNTGAASFPRIRFHGGTNVVDIVWSNGVIYFTGTASFPMIAIGTNAPISNWPSSGGDASTWWQYAADGDVDIQGNSLLNVANLVETNNAIYTGTVAKAASALQDVPWGQATTNDMTNINWSALGGPGSSTNGGWTNLAFDGTGNAITGATADATTLTLQRGTINGGGITNGQTGVTLAGTFSGYGSGLTNVADSTARASITAMGDAIHSRILATVTNGTATLWASSSAWYRVNCDTNALTNWVIDTTGVSAGDTVAMAVEIYRPNANTWAWMPGVTNASPATNATTLNFFVLISGATNWLVNP